MTEQERNLVLKIGLWLCLMEGWTTLSSVRRKFGVTSAAAIWLSEHGFAARGADDSIRWNTPVDFEVLWHELIPERPCPMHFRTSREVEHTA